MKKNRLMRPSAALFPLALAAAQLVGKSVLPSLLLVYYLALQLLSLCAVDCFRNAAAREPGPRKADKRFWGSLPMLIIAPLLLIFGPKIIPLSLPAKLTANHLLAVLAAWLVIIEQLFEERLCTLNRKSDGSLLSLIANGLLFTGLMLDASGGLIVKCELFYTLAAAGVGAAIAVLSSLVIAPAKGFSLLPRNLGFAPKACAQVLLYPAAFLAAYALKKPLEPSVWGFFAGYALWRLCRTVCRRSADESRPLNLMLMAVCAVAVAVLPLSVSLCCLMALVCAMMVFLRISWRNLCGAALLIGAFVCLYLRIPYAGYISVGCGLMAVVINLKNAFLRKK